MSSFHLHTWKTFSFSFLFGKDIFTGQSILYWEVFFFFPFSILDILFHFLLASRAPGLKAAVIDFVALFYIMHPPIDNVFWRFFFLYFRFSVLWLWCAYMGFYFFAFAWGLLSFSKQSLSLTKFKKKKWVNYFFKYIFVTFSELSYSGILVTGMLDLFADPSESVGIFSCFLVFRLANFYWYIFKFNNCFIYHH